MNKSDKTPLPIIILAVVTYLMLAVGSTVVAYFIFEKPNSGALGVTIAFLAPFFTLLCVGLVALSIAQCQNPRLRIIAPAWAACIVVAEILHICLMPTPLESMAMNYDEHHKEMWELKRYAANVLNDSCSLWLEIEGDEVNSFAFDTNKGAYTYLEWHSEDYKPYMSEIGLTQNELDSLIMFLKKTECLGMWIKDNNMPELLYCRPALDGYTYILLDEPLDDEGWAEHDGYSSIPYCDTVVFDHGGPAFGSDKIPERDVKKFVKKYHSCKNTD